MSAHLLVVAGYLDLPQSHKLALMKCADSADDQTRLGYPGMDAVRAWSGTSRSRAASIMRDLQEWGLLMQVTAGHRGQRATFKVFPNPGDEVFSLAAKQDRETPGRDRFKGSPGVPSPEEVVARIAAADAEPGSWEGRSKGSDVQDPNGMGPMCRTLTKGSDVQDPNGERVLSGAAKGPIWSGKGSDVQDPFSPNLQSSTSKAAGRSAPAAHPTASGALFDVPAAPPPPEPEPRPETTGRRVNRLTRTYTDAVPLSNFLAVAGVVRKAVTAERDGRPLYDDEEITAALKALAEENRGVTTETLRIAMEGLPPRPTVIRPARVDVNLARGMDLAARLRARHRPPANPAIME